MSVPYNIDTLFKKYNNKVYRLALSISRNEKDTEDILQNTFLKVINNLKNFRNKSSISTWIYKIAYNEALMNLRRRKSRFKLAGYLKHDRAKDLSGLFVNWSKMPDEILLDSELKDRIDAAVAGMPIKYRMPLLLDNVEGLPLKDSAVILGLKLNSLKTRLHRAHLIIKSDITGYFKDRQKEEEKKNKRCGIWTGFVYDYAFGRLGNSKEAAFKRHIKDCISCNLFLDSYLKAITVTGALECKDLPPELKDRIGSFLVGLKQKNTETFLPSKHLN